MVDFSLLVAGFRKYFYRARNYNVTVVGAICERRSGSVENRDMRGDL